MVAFLMRKSHFFKRWALLSTKLSSWLICWSSKATFSKDGLFLALSLAHDCFLQVQKDIIWTIGRIQHPTWTNSFGFQDIKTVLWNVSKGTKTFSFWWYFNKNPQQKMIQEIRQTSVFDARRTTLFCPVCNRIFQQRNFLKCFFTRFLREQDKIWSTLARLDSLWLLQFACNAIQLLLLTFWEKEWNEEEWEMN